LDPFLERTDPPPASVQVTPRKRFSVRDFFIGLASGVVLTVVAIVLLFFGLAIVASRMVNESGGLSTSSLPVPDFPGGGTRSVYGAADDQWTFKTLDGKPVTLSEYRGKVVFLNFWATWCGPCIEEMPSIQKLQAAVKDDAIAIVLVSDEDEKKIRDFLKSKNWSLTSFRTDSRRPKIFDAAGIPATFIISPDGMLVFRHIGMGQWDHESSLKFLRGLLTKSTQPM
jgi:thiol-disulfide isomerase/thioredoxin